MTLRPLDESAISALLEQVLGGGTSPELLAPVLQRTAGNPFFAEEMVRSLVDAGTLRRNGRWHLDPGWDAGSVPPTVDGVLSARIDLLPPVAAKVLQIASVIGTVIRRPLLHAVATDVAELEEAVRRLLESGFLRPLALVDEEALAFHHPLTLEVAYSRLLRRRWKELHRRVAEATEDLYGAGDDVIDFLARHLYLAEAGEKAVECLLRAAERSKRLFANEEAVFHVTRGLEVLERVPDTPERVRLRPRRRLSPGAGPRPVAARVSRSGLGTEQRSRRHGSPCGRALRAGGAMVFSAVLHHCRRETVLARQQAEATALRASEHGFPLWLAWAQIVRGWALVEEASRPDSKGSEEHLVEVLAGLKENLAAYEGSGSQILRPYWMALAAEAGRRAGQLEEALSLVTCALQAASVKRRVTGRKRARSWRLYTAGSSKASTSRTSKAPGPCSKHRGETVTPTRPRASRMVPVTPRSGVNQGSAARASRSGVCGRLHRS